MSALRRLCALGAVVALVAIGVAPVDGAIASGSGPVSASSTDSGVALEAEFVALLNEARSTPRACGTQMMAAAGPVYADSRLSQASRSHSTDMAATDVFSHTGRDGSTPWDRARVAGHPAPLSENIQAGATHVADAVRAWLNSPGHCRNIMDPDATQVGIGLATNPLGRYGTYWTMMAGNDATVDIGSAPGPAGYRLLAADGSVYACGVAHAECARHHSGLVSHHGDPRADGATGTAVAVDMASTPSGRGYSVLLSDGRVLAYGDAPDLGGVGALPRGVSRTERVSALSMTATGRGYWVFTNLGRAIAFGDARHHGDLPGVGVVPVDDVVAAVAVADGSGYYMLGADGGVFAFPAGVTPFHGSVPAVLGGAPVECPIVGLVPTRTGAGYWMVGCDGGVFAFGDAGFAGSIPGLGISQLNAPIVGMIDFHDAGYLMYASDGGVFTFGAPFYGSLGSSAVGADIVAADSFITRP